MVFKHLPLSWGKTLCFRLQTRMKDRNICRQNRKFNEERSSFPKIRDNLPQIKVQNTSGSDIETNEYDQTSAAYGLYDDHGINDLMVQTTIHAHCSCVGKLRHFLRSSFFKPTLVIECTAQGPGCNIGRMRAINLTQTTTLEYKFCPCSQIIWSYICKWFERDSFC